LQAEECQLKDFGGDYEYYLSKNESEAEKMAVKEARAKAIVQSQVGVAWLEGVGVVWCEPRPLRRAR
jgi:hypothetical protein